MSALELIAAAFGVVSVWLSTRENVLSWPTALVNVALYALVFFQVKLYADMGLQVVYFGLSAYGWHQWKFGGEHRTELRVSRATPRLWATLTAINLLAWVTLATLLTRHTDAVLPWLDSLLSTTSLVAQFMMTRKILENWAVWIVLDLAYVPLFLSRGMYPTAALYAIFLILAIFGWISWRRSWQLHGPPRLAT